MLDLQSLTEFFKWCSIINACLLIISIIMITAAPDFIYGFHGKWFSLTRESFDTIFYGFLGVYKILFLVFNLVPYVALLIIAK